MALLSIPLIVCLFLCFPWTLMCLLHGFRRAGIWGALVTFVGAGVSWVMARFCDSDYYDGAPESAWGWALLAGCLAMAALASLAVYCILIPLEGALRHLAEQRRNRRPARPTSWRGTLRRLLPKLCGLSALEFLGEMRRCMRGAGRGTSDTNGAKWTR